MSSRGEAIHRPLIKVQSLHRRLGLVEAVAGVSFCLYRGQISVLLGANGAGKTTLLRLMAGLLRPGSGYVRVGDREIRHTDPVSRAGVAFVGHNTSSFDELSVMENVCFAAQLRGVKPPANIRYVLDRFQLWNHRLRPTRELSRGLRQRLELAQALVAEPEVILLDEPYNALDQQARLDVDKVLIGCKERAAILIATHDIDHARTISDRILILHNGRLAIDGEAESVDSTHIASVIEHGVVPKSPAAFGRDILLEARSSRITESISRAYPGWIDGWKTLVLREFRAEIRTRELIPAMMVMGILMLLVFSLAFVIVPEDARPVATGAFWSSLVFATVLGAVRGFATERDRGTLRLQLQAPISRSVMFASKWIVNYSSIILVGGISAVMTTAFFGAPFVSWSSILIVLVGSASLATIATMYGALISNIRAREILAPVLMLPVTLPVLIGGVAFTLEALTVTAVPTNLPWLGLVLAYCAILVSLAVILIDYILED